MNAALFETILARFDSKVGGEQLLSDIASQVRIFMARMAIAVPVVTPLDVFRNYRDQNERTSFKVIPVVVDSFTTKVPDPSEAEVKEFFDKYKDVLPDSARPTPGFKIPRQVKAEWLALDANAVTKTIQAKIPEDELRTYYESRKKEFPMDRELPVDLFMGAPELTPPRYLPLSEMRETLIEALARDKANEEIQDTFEKVRAESMDKFSEEYDKVEEQIADAKKDGISTDGMILPKPDDLEPIAKKYGLTHEVSGLMNRTEAETAGRISLARAGTGSASEIKNFASVLFDPKTLIYEGFELSDLLGQRYLIRKIEDVPAHVANLEDVRDEVVRAWKRDKARPLAKKAAEELAAKVKEMGGQPKDLTIDGRPVIAIDAVTKLKPGVPVPSQSGGQFRFERGPATPTELLEIRQAGQPLIDSLFALKPGEVAVEADLPQANYYVLALEKRDPVKFMALMGPNGSLASYKNETQAETYRKVYVDAMARLRDKAGYRPQDYPTDEQERDAAREG
jgi:peptidyl-prolyl cis-trans isomerase D